MLHMLLCNSAFFVVCGHVLYYGWVIYLPEALRHDFAATEHPMCFVTLFT